jgi:cellulose biosynthesis protein BcsQ
MVKLLTVAEHDTCDQVLTSSQAEIREIDEDFDFILVDCPPPKVSSSAMP